MSKVFLENFDSSGNSKSLILMGFKSEKMGSTFSQISKNHDPFCVMRIFFGTYCSYNFSSYFESHNSCKST